MPRIIPDTPGPSSNETHNNISYEKTHQFQENKTVNPRMQTDEYGEENRNRVLGGLNGSGNYVAVPNNTIFNQDVDGTIEAWVNLNAYTSGGAAIISKNLVFVAGINTTGSPFFRIGSTVYTGTTTVPLNTWTHVAFVWSGGPTNFTLAFYVNGVAAGTSGPTAASWAINTSGLRIGASEQFPANFLNGLIDEVRFWEPARTAAQIATNRFVGLGDGGGANSSAALTSSSHYAGLIASWTFNATGSTVWEDIGGNNGTTNGTATTNIALNIQPIPYNFACLFPFGANDYVTVPDNVAFNLTNGGTMEAWVRPTGQTTTHMIMSRGTGGFNLFWGIRASIGNRMVLTIAGIQFENTSGVVIPLDKWTHVAVTWTPSGSNYVVTFYANGVQSGSPVTQAATWNSTSGTLRIGGWHGGVGNNFNGYIDEFRIWNTVRTLAQIQANMFGSCRGLTSTVGLLGAWNFDANLLTMAGSVGGAINGSFNTGGTNNCRFSAFVNESTTGAISVAFISHNTVVNRTVTGNPFPGGFAVKAPYKPITDLNTTRDTIVIGGSGTVTSVELFIKISHTFTADLDITLRAPNGQTRDISSDNGSSSDNGYLTFFIDGQTPVTTTDFLPPYSPFAGPEVAMGNMGSSSTNGLWIIEVFDDLGGDTGVLEGWGIRLNGSVTGIEPISNNIPNQFKLYQNFPNPFNPSTSIKFDVPKDGNVRLAVYDILGKEVKVLVNEFTKAGQYEIMFNASNLSSGTYFYRIETGSFTDVKKMILIK